MKTFESLCTTYVIHILRLFRFRSFQTGSRSRPWIVYKISGTRTGRFCICFATCFSIISPFLATRTVRFRSIVINFDRRTKQRPYSLQYCSTAYTCKYFQQSFSASYSTVENVLMDFFIYPFQIAVALRGYGDEKITRCSIQGLSPVEYSKPSISVPEKTCHFSY